MLDGKFKKLHWNKLIDDRFRGWYQLERLQLKVMHRKRILVDSLEIICRLKLNWIQEIAQDLRFLFFTHVGLIFLFFLNRLARFNRVDSLQKELCAETLSHCLPSALYSVTRRMPVLWSYKMYVYVDASQYPANKLR